jgi:uncharacterized protein YjbI with pentapeptide repeats
MLHRIPRDRPKSWSEHRQKTRAGWFLFFHKLEWYFSWAAWALGNWAFLEVIESLSTFSVLVAVVFYFADSGNRIKQRHYQAWQVINTAQGKGGSGGRIEALQELNHDNVPLIGVDAGGAFLKGVNLRGARLSRCTLQASDLRESDLENTDLTFCNLRGANFRGARLDRAQLQDTDLTSADLTGSNLSRAKLDRADLTLADLRNADLSNITWQQVASFHLANVWGVRNPPEGFVAFALAHGAVSLASDEDWQKAEQASR